MKITVDQVFTLCPCVGYTREQLEQLWRGREALNLTEICGLFIPVEAKIYIVVTMLPKDTVVKFAVECAERVLHIYEGVYSVDEQLRKALDYAWPATDEDCTYIDTANIAFMLSTQFQRLGLSRKVVAAAYAAAAVFAAADASKSDAAALHTIDYAVLAQYWIDDRKSASTTERDWQFSRLKEICAEIDANQ